jgi:lambda family phage portal protein
MPARRKPTVAAKTKAAPRAKPSKNLGTLVNKYDAAGMGRRMKGWNPPTSGPNKALIGLQTIRNRTRDVVRNDWAGAAGEQRWTTNLIGVGITPRFDKIASESAKARYTKLRTDWGKVCDADGVLNEFGQQTLATRCFIRDGEIFGRLRYRRSNFGLIVPLQIQLLESEYCPLLDADTWPFLPIGHRIRSGVELNRVGMRVAYWFYREHPGDNVGSTSISTDRLVRVPADEVMHVFEPKRAGQLRGVPDFASIITKLRNVADFDDAVLERQKIANLFTMFITSQIGNGSGADVDPLTGLPIKTDMDGPIAGLEPGTSHQLLAGEDVKFANPPEAGTTYYEYMRTQNMATAAGQGLPYELMSGDIKEISDRTLRVIINEFRRYCEQRQWQVIIPMWCQKVNDAWVNAGILSGQIAASDADALMNVKWAPHGWAYIHPVQDVQAKQTEVEAGFRSRSSVIGERGDDPETVDKERKADQEREKKLGIEAMQPAPGQGGEPGADGDNIAPGEYPRNEINTLIASVGKLESVVAARANEPRPEPVVVKIDNHVQPPPVTVNTTVEPAAVSPTPIVVENKVDVPASVVNVDVPAPVVNVAAPNVEITNEVPAPEVTVNLPDRKTTSEITRDRNGHIINVTQTETTLQ